MGTKQTTQTTQTTRMLQLPQIASAHAVEPAESPPTNPQIEAALLLMVGERGIHSSACPSEVARKLLPGNWRALMPRVREVASLLACAGQVSVTQQGVVQPATGPWKGPIRIRLISQPSDHRKL